LLKTSDLLSFALIISSDEAQSKAQLNTLSLGENKTDCLPRWKQIYSTDNNFQEKVHISLHWFLYPPDNVLLWKAMPGTAMESNDLIGIYLFEW